MVNKGISQANALKTYLELVDFDIDPEPSPLVCESIEPGTLLAGRVPLITEGIHVCLVD